MLSWSRTFIFPWFYAELSMQDFEAGSVYVRMRTSRTRTYTRVCLFGAALTVGVRVPRQRSSQGLSPFEELPADAPMFPYVESEGYAA